MRNWNIGGTNHFFLKKESCQLFLIRRLLCTMWSAAYSHKARALLICHRMQIASLDSLARRTPRFKKSEKMDCMLPLLLSSVASLPWLQWKRDRVPLFWKGDPAVLELFGAHAALRVCFFRTFQIFSHLLDSMTTQHHHQAPSTERRVY